MKSAFLFIKFILSTTFCLLIIHFAVFAQQQSYYVSSKGSDANSGTRLKPFRSLQKINNIKLSPGAKVYLAGGDIFNGTLVLQANDGGTKTAPVLVASYGAGKAVINGGVKEGILVNSSFTILKHLKVTGAGRKTGNTTVGILMASAKGNLVQDVQVSGFQKSGIEVVNCNNIKLLKLVARNNGAAGIGISGQGGQSKNIIIKDCLAENNPGDPTNLTNHSGNGIIVGGSDSVLIDHCVATNNGWDMPRIGNGPVGIWGYDSNHLTIQYCIAYNNKTCTGASDGGGFDLDGGITNSVIQYCLSYDNEGSGYGLFQYYGAPLWDNNILRYCISVNDGRKTGDAAGILVWSAVKDSVALRNCRVYNNVVYNEHAPAVGFSPESLNGGFLFANNIFMGKNTIVKGPSSGEKFVGNIWWGIGGCKPAFREHQNLTDWANATAQETRNNTQIGKQVNPQLNGPFTTKLTDPYQLHLLIGYQLQANSPLIKSGLDLQHLFKILQPVTDFYGKRIAQDKFVSAGVDAR